MLKNPIAYVALIMIAVSSLSSAQSLLSPGSSAPKLDVKTWVKGNPAKQFKPGQVYVVEFWATWCGPCIETIPHLTQLAKKFDKVHFMGISILEDNDDKRVQTFVESMGSKMDYSVGYSGNKTGMAKSWLEPSRQTGIPTAFIVKDNKILWIGHPIALEGPLAKVLANKFDTQKERDIFDKAIAAQEANQKLRKDIGEIEKQYDDGQRLEARDRLEKVEKSQSGKSIGAELRFKWLAVEDFSAWKLQCLKQMENSASERDQLSMFITANGVMLPEQCKWLVSELISDRFPPDWYPFLCGARMFRLLKEYEKALEFCSRSKKVILDFQAANPNTPKGNALDVIQNLVDQIEKDKKE